MKRSSHRSFHTHLTLSSPHGCLRMLLSMVGRRKAGLPQRVQGVNATNRIFILRVGPGLATLAARQKGSFLWRVTTIWRESTVVRGTLTYLMRNSKPRTGWESLKSIIRVGAGEAAVRSKCWRLFEKPWQPSGSQHSLWLGLCYPILDFVSS